MDPFRAVRKTGFNFYNEYRVLLPKEMCLPYGDKDFNQQKSMVVAVNARPTSILKESVVSTRMAGPVYRTMKKD